MTPTRREFLAAAAAVPLAARVVPAADEPKPPVIDVHTHFYDPTRKEGVPWPGKGDKVLYRPVLPPEYKKLAAPLGVTGTVVVEASPRVEDNQWLLDLAKDEPFLVGVVGRLLPDDKDFVKNLERFAKNPLFRGIRVNEPELRTVLREADQLDRLKALSDSGLTLDANGGHETFNLVAKLAEKLPKIRVVVNHMGNPLIRGGEPPRDWSGAVEAGARAGGNVFCKLSGLVDGTRKNDGTAPKDLAFYTPVVDEVWRWFGPDRLLFGSNWPVSDLYAKFETVFHLASKYVDGKGAAAFSKVFARNAIAAYSLKQVKQPREWDYYGVWIEEKVEADGKVLDKPGDLMAWDLEADDGGCWERTGELVYNHLGRVQLRVDKDPVWLDLVETRKDKTIIRSGIAKRDGDKLVWVYSRHWATIAPEMVATFADRPKTFDLKKNDPDWERRTLYRGRFRYDCD